MPGAARRTCAAAARPARDARRAAARRGVVSCFDGRRTSRSGRSRPSRHHVAAFYRNGALHHFVNRAIVELALARSPSGPAVDDALEAGWQEALRAARPAEVRVLLHAQAALQRAGARRARVGSAGRASRTPARGRADAARAGAGSSSPTACCARSSRPSSSSPAAWRARDPRTARRRDGVPRRVPRLRAPAAAPGPAARRRVRLARAVRGRAAPRRQPRPRRPGPRGPARAGGAPGSRRSRRRSGGSTRIGELDAARLEECAR